MIDLKEVSKSYGGAIAVDKVSLSVPSGQILGFLGPNGAGKTTTMRMITGYMPATSGEIVIDGLNMDEHSIEIRSRIGYLPELAPVYHEMMVLDYLHWVADLRNIPKDVRSKRTKQVIERCGLGSVLQKDIGQLSKGYKQRVGLAQAIIHDPQILILDEPTAGLDPNQIVEIRSLIKELGREKTVVLSTHILSEVHATCSRIVIISKGRIVADNTPQGLQAGIEGKSILMVAIKGGVSDALSKARTLATVDDVRSVPSSNGEIRLRLESKPQLDSREEFFNLAVREKWVILEMILETQSLEEVFHQFTAN